MKKSQKDYQKVNLIIRWMMVLSLLVLFLTFLVSWLIWFFLYRNVVEAILQDFSFITFSIIILVFAGLAAALGSFLIFLRYKTVINNIFSLLSFILSLVVASLGWLVFSDVRANDFLIVGVPWIISISATTVVFLVSSINLILVPSSDQQKHIVPLPQVTVSMPIMAAKQEKTEIIAIETPQEDNTITINHLMNSSNLAKTISSKISNLETKKTENKSKEKQISSSTKWTKKQIKEVWEKGEIIPGVNKDLYRKDCAGAWMFFSAFVQDANEANFDVRSYTWTIAPHKPLRTYGSSELGNLMPMNLINAITKGQNYPQWKTKISSNGNENIIREQIWSE